MSEGGARSTYLADEAATVAYGASLATRLLDDLSGDAIVFLTGDLGAGKTTLVRGILRRLGYDGAVKSPTYTLVEPYSLEAGAIYHLDLYRVGHGEELSFVGIDDLLEERAIKLIEWPERAEGFLPKPDIVLTLTVDGQGRQVQEQIA